MTVKNESPLSTKTTSGSFFGGIKMDGARVPSDSKLAVRSSNERSALLASGEYTMHGNRLVKAKQKTVLNCRKVSR